MEWLVLSLVVSVVLTIILNVAIRLFPGANRRMADRVEQWSTPAADGRDDERVRVFFPWKAMLAVSIGLTVALNLLLWLR